jgi:hypothetical protein
MFRFALGAERHLNEKVIFWEINRPDDTWPADQGFAVKLKRDLSQALRT